METYTYRYIVTTRIILDGGVSPCNIALIMTGVGGWGGER